MIGEDIQTAEAANTPLNLRTNEQQMVTKPSARSGEGRRRRPPMRELTPRTITYNTQTVVITSASGSHNTPCSTLPNRAGTNNRGITDNTASITNANTQRVTYTTLSNTHASSTINRCITGITLTIRATGGTTS